MTFESLGLREELLKAIDEKGYTTPSPIQEKAIPVILERKHLLKLVLVKQQGLLYLHYKL